MLAIVVGTVSSLGAHADLMLENEQRVEDRSQTREILTSAEKARTTAELPAAQPVQEQTIIVAPKTVAPAAAAPAPVYQPAPAPQTTYMVPAPATTNTTITATQSLENAPILDSNTAPTENLSRAELLRRERMRRELQNEDLLQTRLEELRLREEDARTKKLLGDSSMNEEPAPAAPMTAPMETQVIGQGQPATVDSTTVQSASPVVVEQNVNTELKAETPDEEKVRLSVMPRFGIPGTASSTTYTMYGRYTLGIGMGMGVSDNLDVVLGYDYSEMGVGLQTNNPMIKSYQSNYGAYNAETMAFRQNMIDTGLKLHLMGPESKFRPFVGGGMAYSWGYLNYDTQFLALMNNSVQDYQLQQFYGTLAAGFDVRVSKSLSIGAQFKYYAVLSSRQNQQLNNAAFFAPTYWSWAASQEQQYVGGSLARTSMYSLTAGASFYF